MMIRRFLPVAVLALSAIARALPAQSVSLADSLLRRGMLERAESEYYAAVRARPHDANARFALGRYLIARGALRIGATLIDEAMQFGYDRPLASAVLARTYLELGEYEAMERLPASPLPANEKALVHWLATHQSQTISPDSTVLVAFLRTNTPTYLGAARIRVDGKPVVARLSSRSGCGLRLSDTAAVARALHRFPPVGGTSHVIPAAADSIGFGRMTVTNAPLTVEPLPDSAQAILCLGAVARYAPTIDPRANLITLRLSGRPPTPRTGTTSFPLLDIDGQYAISRANSWAPIILPEVAAMLRDRRWTFDARHGSLIIEP